MLHTLSQLKSGELSGITQLTLSKNLTKFPLESLSLAATLEVLDLSNNQLTTLPEALAQCPNLEIVGFKTNKM